MNIGKFIIEKNEADEAGIFFRSGPDPALPAHKMVINI